jgi:signal peptidase I
MLKFLKVMGNSLTPLYREGDFVLVTKFPYLLNKLKPGDVVAFKHPIYGTMIKMIDQVSQDGEKLFVTGTQPDSVDSRQFGTIERNTLIGVLFWHIKNPNPQRT